MVKRAQKNSKKGQRIINVLNLHQNLLNSWVREDVKKIHYFRSRSYMNGALDMATFCQIFSMQSISSLVARCYVLERTLHRAICRGQKQICNDQTTHSLQFLCNTFHVLLSPSFSQMLCGGPGWVLERTRTNLERTKAKATRATAPFIPVLSLRIFKIFS